MLPDQWAIQFLQLEKLYHERLLSNLATLQENWGTARTRFSPLYMNMPENGLRALIIHPVPRESVEREEEPREQFAC